MSILTANFSSDIRGEMNLYVDKFRANGFGCFGRDQILKTCLLLIGANHIFNLRNFNKTNIHSIEKNWGKIVGAITDAVRIVEDFGYSGQLASGYIISIIALFLFRNDLDYGKVNANDRAAMFKFVRTAQITSYFTTSLDRKLNNVLEGMNTASDFADFNDRMAKMDANKALKVTTDDVDDLLTLQYGNPAILPVLQILTIRTQHSILIIFTQKPNLPLRIKLYIQISWRTRIIFSIFNCWKVLKIFQKKMPILMCGFESILTMSRLR